MKYRTVTPELCQEYLADTLEPEVARAFELEIILSTGFTAFSAGIIRPDTPLVTLEGIMRMQISMARELAEANYLTPVEGRITATEIETTRLLLNARAKALVAVLDRVLYQR